jgi:hypothetical protein
MMELVREGPGLTAVSSNPAMREAESGAPTFLNDFEDGFGAVGQNVAGHLIASVPRSLEWLNEANATADLLQNLPSAPSQDPTLASLPKLKTNFAQSPLLRGSVDGHAFAVENVEPLEELDDRDEVELMAEEHNVSPSSSSLKHDLAAASSYGVTKHVTQMGSDELIGVTEGACMRLSAVLNDRLKRTSAKWAGTEAEAEKGTERDASNFDELHLLSHILELQHTLHQCKASMPASSTMKQHEDDSPVSTGETSGGKSVSSHGDGRRSISDPSPGQGVQLRNPFTVDKEELELRSPFEQQERESYAATWQLYNLVEETKKRCKSGSMSDLSQEQTVVLLSHLDASQAPIRARMERLSANAKANRQRSALSSPRSSCYSITSQRSSRAASPALNESGSIGDPVGEAVVAGFGAPQSIARMPAQSRRSSLTFLPNAAGLDRRSSVRSGQELGQRSVNSPPPRYSLESTRSWASNIFPPLSGTDADHTSSFSHAHTDTDKMRRMSSSSDNTFGVHGTGLSNPPAYISEKQHHKTWSDRKASSSSSLVALSDSTRVGLRYRQSSTDKSFLHTRSRSEMMTLAKQQSLAQPDAGDFNLVQRSLDRFYGATPQLSDQRAQKLDVAERRLSQREEDFTLMFDRLSRLERMDDQRAASPRLRSTDLAATHGQTPVDTGGSSSSSRRESAVVGRTGRLASVGSLSFAPLRRASLLWGNSSKGKEKDVRHDDGLFHRRSSMFAKSSTIEPKGKVEQILQSTEDGHSNGSKLNSTAMRPTAKLEKMGQPVSTSRKHSAKESVPDHGLLRTQDAEHAAADIMDIITSTARMKRMPNQDAVPRSRPAGLAAASDAKAVPDAAKDVGGKSGGEWQATNHADLSFSEHRRNQVNENEAVSSSMAKNILAAGVRITAETQDRLGVIVVTIWLEGECVVSSEQELQYRVVKQGEQMMPQMIVNIGSKQGTLTLPARSANVEHKTSKDGDKWTVRLPLVESSADSQASRLPTIPYSASELKLISCGQLSCAECYTRVADLSAIRTYLSLPSQHWEELVDAWMCHEDQELNETLIKAQSGLECHRGLRDGQAHISDRHIIMSSSNADLNAVEITEVSAIQFSGRYPKRILKRRPSSAQITFDLPRQLMCEPVKRGVWKGGRVLHLSESRYMWPSFHWPILRVQE